MEQVDKIKLIIDAYEVHISARDIVTIYTELNSLMGIIKNQSNLINNMAERGVEIKRHLDLITEHAKPCPEFVGARVAAEDLRKRGWGAVPKILDAIADYLDSEGGNKE